jgi:ubiquinone/menaquinone biosynthesis C-methylase UbiE
MGHLTDAGLVRAGRAWKSGPTEVDMTETFQITKEQAQAYEELFVPALFAQWAPKLLDIANVTTGQRVLDVACGTGVVTRAAADRVGDPGRVVGLDLNPAMIEVAASVRPDIQWRRGDAANLPFDDVTFDAVLCQSALFFFPDPDTAIGEMSRVVRPGGTVAVQTYASLDAQPAYGPFVDGVLKYAGPEARSLVTTYFAQGDPEMLAAAFVRAGLEDIQTRTPIGTARYASVDALVEIEVQGTPLADRLSAEVVERILAECRQILDEYSTASGTLELPIRAVLIAGRKA